MVILEAAIANGLVKSNKYKSSEIILTKRKEKDLEEFKSKGFITTLIIKKQLMRTKI